jgi:hypothetical protein
MASWAVVCTNCNSKILHTQVTEHGLAEFFIPARPEVSAAATITCPKCQTTVSFVRTDLRYIAT